MKASTIKQGLLVSLKTTISGGVNYQRRDVEPDHGTETGGRVARWETIREITDATEHEQAIATRSLVRSAILKACCSTSFGLLCPTDKEQELSTGIAEAARIAAEFNTTSKHSRVDVYVLAGRVASDDVEAARAISAEVRELIDAMQAGIAQADPETIREAANKARIISGMLSEDVAVKVSEAVAEARKAARDIVKRVEKAGEAAAVVVASCNMEKLNAARFAVLDIEAGAVESVEIAGRSLDLDFTGEQMPEVQS